MWHMERHLTFHAFGDIMKTDIVYESWDEMLSLLFAMIDDDSDKKTLEHIYHKHHQRLRRKALQYTRGNTHDAEDILQECWSIITKQFSTLRFNGEKSELVYLHTVLKNCAKNYLRKAESISDIEALHDVEDDSVFVSNENLEDQVCGADLERRVQQIVHEMSMEDREILLLIKHMGYTAKDAAKIIGIQPEAAQKRLSRALGRLANKLREAGIIDDH